MEITPEQVGKLVEEVVKRVKSELDGKGNSSISPSSPSSSDGIFSTIDEAIPHAEKSQAALLALGIEKRKELIAAMRKAAIENAEYLAEMAHKETGLGRPKDKVAKNLLAARKTPGCEDLDSRTYTGDDGLTLVEMAPYGVIGSITPTTNPSSTVINNSISMIAAGNAVVFNPHPSAKGVSNETVRVLNRAIRAAGGPETLLCSLAEPTLETSKALMTHPRIKMLVVTGGGEVVKAAMSSGKKVIAAGPGNPPVIVDETANLKNAAKHIVDGASFDNCILCIAEKEVFAVSKIVDELKSEMKKHGAYEINGMQADELVKVLYKDTNKEHPITNKKFVGRDARVILEQIGVHAGTETRLIIAEVDESHPFVYTEMLMPVLPIVRARDVDDAIEKAVRAENGCRHTAIMHSENVVNMTKAARALNVTIFVKNAPSYAGLGFGGEGFTTLTIAGPTGEGLTSARCFTRQRRCVLKDSFRII